MSTRLKDRFEALMKEVAETRRETVETRRDLAQVQRELAAFRAAIEESNLESAPSIKDHLLTRKKAACYAGVHPTTLDRLAKKHPYLYVSDGNGRRRYSKMMLDDFRNGRV